MSAGDGVGRPLPDRCVHELFASWAAVAPDGVAVVCGDERMTYRELDLRSNRWAHLLRAHGVGAEVPVALCMERGVEVVAVLLGVLKAGGHYVPLDPDYPAERLDFMLADARASIVVTQRRVAERLALRPDMVVLTADLLPRSDGPLDVIVAPDNLAYVMYTSGSTGRPKGVLVTHRNIVALVHGADYADFHSEQVFLLLAPLSFDASTFEVWGALCHGATLAVFPPEAPTAGELEKVVRRHGVSMLWLAAGLFRHIVDTRPTALAGVAHVLAGGDVLPAGAVRTVLTELGTEISNGYGPTECTTFSCVRRGITVAETEGKIPIGPAIAHTDVYVVDDELNEAVTGELLIGGAGLARGYLGRPELTAERFIPDPFSSRPGERVYRTGDLVRRPPDDVIEFIGRRDQQVKIRGFRVEPGEIEAVLTGHPGVRDAVVSTHEDAQGGRQLVGYVVANANGRVGCGPSVNELRAFLGGRLPEYMVPTAWVEVDALPLSANGKVDRAALPVPGAATSEVAYAEPGNPVERAVAEVWSEVLGVPRVGVHDDFFDLGGHSLLATQVTSLLAERFPIDLPVSAVFEAPTVERLAAAVYRAIEAHVARLSESEVDNALSQLAQNG